MKIGSTEYAKKKKNHITHAHPYFTLLHVYWRPHVVIVLTIRSPPAATPPTHCSMNRKAWRRMKKAHSVLHCSSSRNPHGQDFFSFPPGCLPVKRISPWLTALHCPNEICPCVLWLFLQMICLYQTSGQTSTSVLSG